MTGALSVPESSAPMPVALVIEMGCDAEDIAVTIHPHPTLSETVAMGAEVFSGTITDLYMPKRR